MASGIIRLHAELPLHGDNQRNPPVSNMHSYRMLIRYDFHPIVDKEKCRRHMCYAAAFSSAKLWNINLYDIKRKQGQKNYSIGKSIGGATCFLTSVDLPVFHNGIIIQLYV